VGGGQGAAGAEVERRRREDRGAEGAEGGEVWGGGVPLPTGRGDGGGGCAPSPENFLILALNMVSFGAFWKVFFYSSATCFTRKTRVQPLYAYKSPDGETPRGLGYCIRFEH